MHTFALAWLACTTPEEKPVFAPPPEAPKERDQLVRMVVHQGGAERTAWVHLPDGSGAGKPVLFVLAGGKLGEGRRMVQVFDHWFDRDVVLVFPNAKSEGDEPQWDGIGSNRPESMDDVEFLKALADQVVRKHEANRDRVFVAGYASGGFETWQLACFASDVFKGFASVAASLPVALQGCGAAGFPHPVLLVGGTEDRKSEWDGDAKNLSFLTSVETFAPKNGCDPKTHTEVLLDDLDPEDGARVKRHAWTCTGAKTEVLEITGGGHPWPRKDGEDKGLDKACRDIDAADQVMAFFGLIRP